MADDSAGIDATEAEEATSSRRNMLRTVAIGAAGAAAAGVAGMVASAGAASADDGDPVILGGDRETNDHNTRTFVNYLGSNVASSVTVEAGTTAANEGNDGILNNAFANQGTAFIGIANTGGPQNIGVIGWSKTPNGTGVVGFTGGAGAYGGEFFGGLAEIRLRPNSQPAPPLTLTNAHLTGELYEDSDGTLWLCVVAGSPGSWRKLGGPTTAGAFHAISPKRVYDSRTGAGKLQPAVDRTISVALSNGVEVVPPFATAVAMTFTVTNTEGDVGGFVSVRPAGTAFENTSSINWFGPNQNLATTVISALGPNRDIILRGGENLTDAVVDITGYYL
jgi:hypothetical protein